MAFYNPINYDASANQWTYIDNALSGANTNTTLIYAIAYSGSNLYFGGSFIANYSNQPYQYPFTFPISSFQYINLAYFDSNLQRFLSLKNIGTRNQVFSSNESSSIDKVLAITLCGSNLVAAGKFNNINTLITGFSTVTHIARSDFYTLSDTWPFNTTLPPNTTLKFNDWIKLTENIITVSVATSTCFAPSFSGDVAKNIAYYDNTQKKWLPFSDSANIINNSDGYLTSLGTLTDSRGSKVLYTAGSVLTGNILYYNVPGSRWDFTRPALSTNKISNAMCLSLVDDNRNNLIYCGTFSGINNISNYTGIAKFNGTVVNGLCSYGTGITGTSAFVYSAVMSGDTVIASGIFPDKIVYFDTLNSTVWKRLYPQTNNSIYLSSNFNFTSVDLDQNNDLVTAGNFFNINDNIDLVGFARLSPSSNYTFDNIGPLFDTDVFTYGKATGQIIFVNDLANYTVASPISADFLTSDNLRTHKDLFRGSTSIRILGTSPYQGASGIKVL